MTSWSDTQIVLTVPANVIAGTLKMQNGNAAESDGIAYTIVPPVLTSISPTSIATGMQVTLTGSGFGASKDQYGAVFFGGQETTSVTSWSDTQIVLTVPANVIAGTLKMQNGNAAESNGIAYTTVQPPILSSVSPNSGGIGSVVTISGSNMGTTGVGSTVTFNGVVATPTTATPTSIVVPVPSGATTGNVVVTLSGLSSNGVAFALALSVSAITPVNGATAVSTGASVALTFNEPIDLSTVNYSSVPISVNGIGGSCPAARLIPAGKS